VLKILALSPHTDDAELGCGGTLHALADQGATVLIVAFTAPTPRLRTEFHRAAKALHPDIEARLLSYQRRLFPETRQAILDDIIKLRGEPGDWDIVFVPSPWDVHQDHQVIYAEALRTFKSSPTAIYAYEQPWNQVKNETTAYSPLQRSDIDAKLAALKEYHSQAYKPYFDPYLIEGIAHIRGMQCGSLYAEAFHAIRTIIPTQR